MTSAVEQLTPEKMQEIIKNAISSLQQLIDSEPEKPTVLKPEHLGERKEGGWGADLEFDKYYVTEMTDPDKQGLYKIVDQNGNNVTTKFTTKEFADTVLEYIQAAKHVFEDDEDEDIPDTKPEEPEEGTGIGYFGVKAIEGNGDIYKEVRQNFRNDGKRFDITGIKSKGVELTGYFALDSPISDEVSGKYSTLRHSGENRTDCYDMGVSTQGGRSRIRFEQIHPNYTNTLATGHVPAPLLGKQFIGYKFIKKPNPDKTVTCRILVDQGNNEGNKPANEWKEIFKWKDTKYKIDKVQPYATLRIDDPKKAGLKQLRWKWVYAQEIN